METTTVDVPIAPVPHTTAPETAEAFFKTFEGKMPAEKIAAARGDYLARRANPPAPAAPPAAPTQFRPTQVLGPDHLPASADTFLSASASVQAEAMPELISRGLAAAPTSPEFAPPIDGRYDLAFTGADQTEMHAALSAMSVPASHGRAMAGALDDSVRELSASPAFKQAMQARDEHALGRIDDAELSARSSAFSNYVAEQRKVVENVLRKPYLDVAKVAALAVSRLDQSWAGKMAREGGFEQASVMIQLYRQGLLLAAKSKR